MSNFVLALKDTPMNRIITLLAALLLAGYSMEAQVTLSPLFSDNMVLQRDSEVPVWGKAKAGSTVKVMTSWDGMTHECIAGADRKWSVKVDTPPAGGPFEITISNGKGKKRMTVLHNVMSGDVWLCSGQSNMEMPVKGWGRVNDYEKELEDACNYPELRVLNLVRTSAFDPSEDFKVVRDRGWEVSSYEAIEQFSACGYFFGREIQKSTGVPVGLINSSYGGTMIEGWTTLEALGTMPSQKEFIAKRSKGETQGRNADSLKAKWREDIAKADRGMTGTTATWAQPQMDDSAWKTMHVPGNIETVGLGSWDGVIWFRYETDIPESWEGKDLTFNIQSIDDDDWTYWNGKLIGHTVGFNIFRRYTVPGKLVKAGRNVIAVRVLDNHLNCGLLGERDRFTVSCGDESINVSGEWKYCIGSSQSDIDVMPQDDVTRPDYPSNLYNTMIHPLIPFDIKGAIWYQGESNSSDAEQYAETLPIMIADWRRLWGSDFPFYIVQLCNYKARQEYPDIVSEWAELREAQSLAADAVKDAHMCVTIDIGDADDIHPKNKQEVGRRLALLALKYTYGQDIIADSPKMESYSLEGDSIRIRFKNAGTLKTLDGSGTVKGFAIAGSDRKFHFAQARIEGTSVVVSCPEVKFPLAVRYAWGANPDCNLCGETLLPVGSFRTDRWGR